MRRLVVLSLGLFALAVRAADVESRVLTHYIPQDLLETTVRTEGWTKVPLTVAGGLRKGDVVRVWTGGSIDRGNGDQPGQNVNGPGGAVVALVPGESTNLALAADPKLAYCLLFKSDTAAARKSPPPGKPLEIPVTRDKEEVYLGFNDLRGRFQDNHLGKGRRHELDPLWVRIEVVRIIVD